MTKIAAIHRGRKSRAEVQLKKKRVHAKEKQQRIQAVNKIAAVQRGRIARRMLLEKKEEDTTAHHKELYNTESTVSNGGGKNRFLKMDSDPKDQFQATVEIQAVPKGQKHTMGKREAAAVNKIAALQRGRKAREELQKRRDHRAAVTKIAAVYRGRQVRKGMQERREQTAAVNKIAALQRGRKVRIGMQEEKMRIAAANKIAAVQRGRVVRKAIHESVQKDSDAKLQPVHGSTSWNVDAKNFFQRDVEEVLRRFDKELQHTDVLNDIKAIDDQETLKVKISDELASAIQGEGVLSQHDDFNGRVTTKQGTALVDIENKKRLKDQLNQELDSLISDDRAKVFLSDIDGL